MIFVLETYDSEKLYVVLDNIEKLLNILNNQKIIDLSFWQWWINVSSIKRYYDKVERNSKDVSLLEDKICSLGDLSIDRYIWLLKKWKELSPSALERFILNCKNNNLCITWWKTHQKLWNKLMKKKLN